MLDKKEEFDKIDNKTQGNLQIRANLYSELQCKLLFEIRDLLLPKEPMPSISDIPVANRVVKKKSKKR